MLVATIKGASAGYNYTKASTQEAEVKKGTNDYLGAFSQASQISQFCVIGGQLSNAIPNTYTSTGVGLMLQSASLLGWLACPVFAAAKQGHYEDGMKFVKSIVAFQSPAICRSGYLDYIPDKLSTDSEKLCTYFAENLGSITKIAMIAGTLALPCAGSSYFAAGIMAPMIYHLGDSNGFVPINISRVMEKYLPTIASFSVLLNGGIILPTIASVQLLSYNDHFNKFMQAKVDKTFKKLIDLGGPTIEEIEAPLIVNKHLTFTQINAILDTPSYSNKFTINPAHCAKSLGGLEKLPEDKAFTKLLVLFQGIIWKDKYILLKNSFADDDRFIKFLKKQFPADKKKVNKSTFEYYLKLHIDNLNSSRKELFETLVAKEKLGQELTAEEIVEKKELATPLTKEIFLAKQLEKQLQELVKALSDERRIEGLQTHLTEAIRYCARICGYLLTLDPTNHLDMVIIEDTLLKLAIEGGEYCALGVKRAAKELVNGIIMYSAMHSLKGDNANAHYECLLQLTLEMHREKLVNALYKKIISVIPLVAKGNLQKIGQEVTDNEAVAIAEDVHTLNIYQIALKYGIVPLSKEERRFGFDQFYLWSNPTLKEMRNQIYNEYEECIDGVIKELGHIHFAEYVKVIIEQNNVMSDEDKEKILERFTLYDVSVYSSDEIQKRFNRFVLVMLGVFDFPFISEGWVEEGLEALPNISESDDDDWLAVNTQNAQI